jgi:hypothetical protein
MSVWLPIMLRARLRNSTSASFLLAAAALFAGQVQAAMPRYTVDVDAKLSGLAIEACFETELPSRLVARNDNAPRYLRDPRVRSEGDQRKLELRHAALQIPHAGHPGCIEYRIDLDAIPTDAWRRGSWRAPGAVLLDPDLVLWYPQGVTASSEIEIRFRVPPGFDISAPWERAGVEPRFGVRDRYSGWGARIAIGRFAVEPLELPGGRLRVAILPGDPPADHDELREWITSGASALLTAYGRLPVPDAQVLVVPIGRGDEPVPWGEVMRGGGDAVHLFIDQRRPPREFMADWVLAHELSHLLHPRIAASDRWLSEGLASYYQNVLCVRSGLMSVQAAWEELHAGFERGIRGTPRGRTLAEVSENMMRDRSFMRVYWSGAAIALLADVDLRRRSGGEQSLDTALAAFARCCLPSDHGWRARELMQRLDELTGDTVFTELYRRYVDSDDFPELRALYTQLGIEPIGKTEVHLNPAAPEADIREAIMAAPSS